MHRREHGIHGRSSGFRGRLLELGIAMAVLASMVALGAAPTSTDLAPSQPQGRVAAPAERHTPTPAPATSPAAPTDHGTAPLDPQASALTAFYGQHIAWKTCGEGSCATVRVPVAYDQPDGETLAISLFRLKARDGAKRRGTLFFNPGGPGASGIDFVRNEGDYFGKRVREAWDIVGFDPRGMGASGGFDCFTNRDLDQVYAADPTPDTSAERRELVRATRARLESCLRRGGALALNMGTEDVVRDLDILRDAVGDERLNYFGASYGTLIGSIYVAKFTSQVGFMVLDSVVPPDTLQSDDAGLMQVDVDASAVRVAEGLEAMMRDFAEDCIADGCPLGSTVEQVTAAVVRLLDRLDQRPARTAIPSLPSLTEGWAATAVNAAIGQPEAWDDLVDGLVAVRDHGDGTGLAYLAMSDVDRSAAGTYPSPGFGKNRLPVTCADWPMLRSDPPGPSPAVFTEHPLLGRLKGTPWIGECTGWPGKVHGSWSFVAEPPTPVLVIGNERDPLSPVWTASGLTSMITGSRLVRVDEAGHGAYGQGNTCADRVVDDYLVRGVPPTDEITSCPVN